MSHGTEVQKDPNVIPMIDILLVLLITAILGLLPMWKVQVMLPQPTTSVQAGTPLVLTVAKGPTYALNGTPIARDRLIPDLAEIFHDRPEKILFIDGARDARYQDVFYVYGAVRSAGVTVTAMVPPGTERRSLQPR